MRMTNNTNEGQLHNYKQSYDNKIYYHYVNTKRIIYAWEYWDDGEATAVVGK